MKIITKTLSLATLSLVMGLTSFTGASALPLPAANSPQVADVEAVQYRRDRDWRDNDRGNYSDRRGWYQGQRGYRDRRAGYRRHNDGFWYPRAAFGAAAIIGGAIASQPRASGSSHVQWCANRYQSYRAYDDTYSPRAGVRARCNSPY
jgi:hypothetical protein